MKSKNEVLSDIVELAKRNQISAEEITRALQESPVDEGEEIQKQKIDNTMKIFSYLGGIFIFSGIAVYIGMFWSEMNSAARIIITLGSGIVLYCMALLLDKNNNYQKMITPLFLVSALLIPTGLFVTLFEFAQGGDIRYARLYIFGIVFLQQILTFSKIRRTVLVFTSLFFAFLFWVSAFNLFDAADKLINTTLGLSLLCVAYGLNKTEHRALAPLTFLVGGGLFLWGSFDYLQHTYIELLYLLITCLMIYLSAFQKSRTLLFVSTCALLGYISYFTSEHFVNSVGWPITLIALGCIFFAIGVMIVKIHRKYIRK